MTERDAVATAPLEPAGIEPATAYAKLRTYTPGRASFLLESRTADEPAGRHSIVGYRVQQGEMLPPGIDAIAVQVPELAAAPSPASLAEALAQSVVGYLSYTNTHTIHGIRHWEGELVSGHFLRGAVVIVYDHHDGTAAIGAPRPGKLVERCAWELAHGPDVSPPPPWTAGAEPEHWTALPDVEGLAARAARALRFLSDPSAELVLAQRIALPLGDADPWDVYRALAGLRRDPFGFFVDFGETPAYPRRIVLGTSGTVLLHEPLPEAGPSDPARLAGALRAAFPHPSLTGSAPVEAAQVIRRVEDWPRDLLGAAVGYLCPGGAACFALGETVIAVEGSGLELTVPVRIGPDVDPAELGARCRQAAAAGLAAIRAAQDAARARAATAM